eukprot:896439-Rhodomonas_salina.2
MGVLHHSLAEHKGYNCDDIHKMQVADQAELDSLQDNMAHQIAHTIACQSVKALYVSFVKKTTTQEQDYLQGVLCSQYMKAVKVWTHYNSKWLGTLVFQNPAVYVYVAIKHHFESLADIVSVNLGGELAETLLTKTNVNINEVAQHFDKVIDPNAQAYTSVPDFVNYIKASLQYEVIWKRLHAANARGQRLSLAQIAGAVKLAESHLKECTSQEAKIRMATATPAASDADTVVTAEQKSTKARTHKAKDAKIRKLKAPQFFIRPPAGWDEEP